ncbi:MAG: protein kinase [Verrucomicrobiia bacterium]
MQRTPDNGSARPNEKSLFVAARELTDPAQRRAFLDAACAGDPAMRQRLEDLLQAEAEAGQFFVEGAEGLAPPTTIAVGVTEKPGDRVGRYKLLQQIGEGGCGVVYMAEQEEPVRRRVALKVIKLGMETKQVIARFEAERQALALMDHPNIAKVLDAGATETGRPYFVMELVRGIKITEYCDQNNLSTRERLDLFVQVCHAIQHAHQKGVIHRDIKPSNILVSLHDGVPVPVIIDFGIAKATEQRLTDKTLFTAFEQFIGTPAYTSPEQAEMSRLDIDTRSDIYSLGVLLYELLTGKTPFDAKELLAAGLDEMRRTIREKEPARPSTRLNTLQGEELTTTAKRRGTEPPKLIHLVRGDLDWIVMKCLEKDRTRRYETANGLALDVERHLRNEAVAACPPSKAYRVRKFVRRNKVMVTSASMVVLALSLGIIASTWLAIREARARKHAQDERLLARQQAYAADINLAQQKLAGNNLGAAKDLLEALRPRPGEPDLRGWEWRHLWDGCQSDALSELCQRPDSVCRVAYSPDGRTLALAGYMEQVEFVELWDVTNRTLIASLQTNAGHRVAFSPQGGLLVTDTREGLNVWRAGTTNLVAQIPRQDPIKAFRFSPDGAQLASLSDTGTVEVLRVGSWTLIRQLQVSETGDEHGGDLDFSPDGKALVVGGWDGRISVIDLETGDTRLSFRGHPDDYEITTVAWSPKASLLASGGGYSSHVIRLWDVESGDSKGSLTNHSRWVCQLVFSADGQRLFSASADQTIRIWDVQEKRCLATLRGHTDEVYSLALSPDGSTLATGSKDGVVDFWNANPPPKEEQPRRLAMSWEQAAFAPDSRSIAVPQEGVVHLYELPLLREVESIPMLGTDVVTVAFSPDGSLIASGNPHGWLRVWSCAQHRLLQAWHGYNGITGHLRFLNDGARLLSTTYSDGQGELVFWDTRTGRRLSSLLTPRIGIWCTSSDGRLGFAGDDSGQVSWLNTGTGTLVPSTRCHRKRIRGGAFSPDGTQAASVAEDGVVVVWDTSTFRPLRVFDKAHMNAVFGVAFSPDGRRLATSSGGRDAVKLWDLATGRELLTLPGAGSLFTFVAFSPDNNWLVARNHEGQLHLWHAPSWSEIQTAAQ